MIEAVIDLSHWNADPIDFAAVKASGILAVIHKATQGASAGAFDPKWGNRRETALAAGLLFGTYHFGTGDASGAAQAEHYLTTVGPNVGELLMLDLERASPTMTLGQASDFVQTVHDKTGVWPVLYGGRTLAGAGVADAALRSCPYFLAEYGPVAHLPAGWSDWSLWQYTATGKVAGIAGNVDCDRFNGTVDELRTFWGAHAATIPAP